MSDTVADLPDGDYFWLAVDIDRNEKVTPYRDITFRISWASVISSSLPFLCVEFAKPAHGAGTGLSGSHRSQWM